MFVKNYKKTKCKFGCDLFNDNTNYLYWENREPTSDEFQILNYLKKKKLENSKILHIGIGSSLIAKNINCKNITGISISKNEIDLANSLNIKHYKCFFLNKLSKDAFNIFLKLKFDFIIDVNLKSFSCCSKAFENMFSDYVNMLSPKGIILSSKKGMGWSGVLKPVYKFSIKKFFYRKLKEFKGPSSNLLSVEECFDLANKNTIKFKNFDNSDVVEFSKY